MIATSAVARPVNCSPPDAAAGGSPLSALYVKMDTLQKSSQPARQTDLDFQVTYQLAALDAPNAGAFGAASVALASVVLDAMKHSSASKSPLAIHARRMAASRSYSRLSQVGVGEQKKEKNFQVIAGPEYHARGERGLKRMD